MHFCHSTKFHFRFLALGEQFQPLHYYLHVGATTIGKTVYETCVTIWEEQSAMFMKKPTTEKWIDLAENLSVL